MWGIGRGVWPIGFERSRCHNGGMDLPADSNIRWLVRRYAALLARDKMPYEPRVLVLPNGEFFPDEFDGDVGSVNLLFWRLQEHSGMTDVDVELRFVDDRGEHDHGGGCGGGSCGGGSCGGGSCGRADCNCKKKHLVAPPVVRLPDAYRVDVLLSEASSPVTLTAYLATALARVHLEQTGGLEEFADSEWRATCELGAISLGFGVLVANASHIFSKSCGGVNVKRATALTVMETALGLAVFLAAPHQRVTGFTSLLDPTQRSAYAEAKLWADSNAKLLRWLYREPERVAQDEMLTLAEAKPWLARVLGIGGKAKRGADVFDEQGFEKFEADQRKRMQGAGMRKSQLDPEAEELRALVQESLEQVKVARQ